MSDPVRKVWREDGRYAFEAYHFLFSSLDEAVRLTGRGDEEGSKRHVSGNELLDGMRRHASSLYGPMAARVWRSWGIQETVDWGRIVFLLVDAQLLNRQEEDSLEDFEDGFDFDEAFVDAYRPDLPPEGEPLGGDA
tara:strand:- start:9789 stop:10196 length:408 start_codon:yes stop_codon:yes gene_type:complete